MKSYTHLSRSLLASLLLTTVASAYDSGSTGVDGEFHPQVDTQVQLPPDGIFNYTTVTIPAGVTVTFAKNTRNTPVTWLVSGDVSIGGVINLDGRGSTPTGTAGDGNIADDGIPGEGGPGGFAGGVGGRPGINGGRGGHGLGPGGGTPGFVGSGNSFCGGIGGGFRRSSTSFPAFSSCRQSSINTAYSSPELLPLIGGSGGGGGLAGSIFAGSGGGGGGGAILIAASGTVTHTGAIVARGGRSSPLASSNNASLGGSGSGGAIRVVATTIAGNGGINAQGGDRVSAFGGTREGYQGSEGFIRLEAENFLYTASTSPTYSFSAPQPAFIPNLPGLRITQVAGLDAPLAPSGVDDIILPLGTPNPVTVVFSANGIPLGNTITLTVTPQLGEPVTSISTALSGTLEDSTASVAVDIPDGPSVLQATVSFTVVASLGDALSTYAQGERVEQIEVSLGAQGQVTTLIAASGKRYAYPGVPSVVN